MKWSEVDNVGQIWTDKDSRDVNDKQDADDIGALATTRVIPKQWTADILK